MKARLTRFEWGALAVIAAAFVVRITFLLQPTIIWDSAWYLMLSRSFVERGDFWLRWTDPAAPQFSGYWPPLFPIFVAPLIKLFGPSYHTLVLGSILGSVLLTGAVYFTTRDLFGRTSAFAAAAIVAANPAFYVSDSKGMSESLLAFAITMMMWAFLKSLSKPQWLPVAGAFAFMAYLGKASLGLPLVAAGILALGAWRVWTRGWRRVLTSKWDMGLALAAVALGIVLLATRTERVGGIGVGLIEPIARAFNGASCGQLHEQLAFVPASWGSGVHCWAMLYPLKVAFVGAFLLVVTLPFSLKLLEAARAKRTEATDALWLGTLLPLLAGAIFTTSFFFTERRNLIDFDNIRYLTPSMIPFLWLVLPHWKLDADTDHAGNIRSERLARRHNLWFGLAIGGFFLLELLNPIAGHATLKRLMLFLWLSVIPITLGILAYNTQYTIAERRLANGGVERRYVPLAARRPDWRILFGGAILLLASAWFFSAWYVTVGAGLLVAMTTMSAKLRVLAMGLVLLGSSAPGVNGSLPVEAAADALEKLPAGTIVGMNEQIVFPAAVAPSHITMRLIDPEAPIPDDIDALLMQHAYGNTDRVYDNFSRVAAFDYKFEVSPTLKVRIWIEKQMLGQVIDFQRVLGETLYVRNGTGLDEPFHPR